MLFGFGIKDIIDILCVATMLYYVYKLMKYSGSLNVFYGILIFIGIWIFVSHIFEMRLLGVLFDKLMSVGVLALIILFQEDIRRFFLTIGSQKRLMFWFKLFRKKKTSQRTSQVKAQNPAVMQIVLACSNMSNKYVGALIVIERNMVLSDISKTGEMIDAKISQRLLQNIFFKNSPLHDGAVIISHNRIESAACLLPVAHNTDIPEHLGLRHRAALGITQQSDAVAIVVSEETGNIAIAQRGNIRTRVSKEELEAELSNIF